MFAAADGMLSEARTGVMGTARERSSLAKMLGGLVEPNPNLSTSLLDSSPIGVRLDPAMFRVFDTYWLERGRPGPVLRPPVVGL